MSTTFSPGPRTWTMRRDSRRWRPVVVCFLHLPRSTTLPLLTPTILVVHLFIAIRTQQQTSVSVGGERTVAKADSAKREGKSLSFLPPIPCAIHTHTRDDSGQAGQGELPQPTQGVGNSGGEDDDYRVIPSSYYMFPSLFFLSDGCDKGDISVT
jgi:hypothetical protein